MNPQKIRLDALLFELGKAKSLANAQALIGAGVVWVDGKLTDKAGQPVFKNALLEVRVAPFVSRAGLKLAQALEFNKINVKELIALDVGVGHGGFSDCLLQAGVKKIFGIDAGKAFLDPKIATNPRMNYYAQTNFRNISSEFLPQKINFFCVDVSFISLTKIIPKLVCFLKSPAHGVLLIKPQFEARKENVEAGGVVTLDKTQTQVIAKINDCAAEYGLKLVSVIAAKTTGKKKKNQEFLAYYKF